MTPFRPKGLINPSPNTRFPGGPKGVDGLPSGHPNLNGSHSGLLKDFPRGILVIEVLPASLRPKEVEEEVAKDVKWLSNVGEAPYMVLLDPGGIIFFSLKDGFIHVGSACKIQDYLDTNKHQECQLWSPSRFLQLNFKQ